ncbi:MULTISPECIES: ornithine--oxo-acid transaminase [Streptomyces]|uniref:ornithine aminotransferase n=1 Tax=Streptomyces sviceus (strain ATCC 29083 / DSM 924 / JCM 4929 / NBRC 13980 / NCIMB 11184 / NRRL 5439 / UC 5370) TaxID=463191 RepID=B5HTW7_STRX2|nr:MULTISPECIES: ornithine--oxo-acid transaminase [Streptomyces]EDY56249.1 ornithine-oxo-acid transaminase [Streptomyces sviceus ATCC 29083]MYT07096.1 ornithine--oxo-acid transaminase [Streptomyces sp. SID5470]
MPVDVLSAQDHISLAERWGAHDSVPFPVVLSEGEGAWMTDVEGRRYLDFHGGYSASNFGHGHPELVAAAKAQLDRMTLSTRAFHHDQYGPFCRELAELTGTETVLLSNSGGEAVDTAVKIARKWAYQVKGVPDGAAEIIVAGANFHGRTTTIVSFSTQASHRAGFGPFTPGFKVVPFGDIDALRSAITGNTAAVLLEPIQGEAGVIVPPKGYLGEVRELCDESNTLFVADEVQCGMARAGSTLALDHEGVRADMYTLGKSLSGGLLPVSAVVGRADVLGVITPGDHGSTFGGNPLACAVGRAAVRLLATGEFQARSRELGAHLHARLAELDGVTEVRGRGLWAGVQLAQERVAGRRVTEELAERGLLCKEAKGHLRVAPPLVVTREEIDLGVDIIADVLG